MRTARQVSTWVTPAIHLRVRGLAVQRGISVSSLLAELLNGALEEADGPETPDAVAYDVRPDRVAIRLRPGDVKAIRGLAELRRMKPSTYIAALVRAHLIEDPPLPTAELAVLERAAAEVGAIGRNLNQIARAVNSGSTVPAATASIIGRSIEAVEGVRAAAKAYIRVAIASWEAPLE